MNILWITNDVITTEQKELMGIKSNGSGGWVGASLNELAKHNDYNISVATIAPVKNIVRKKLNSITYYFLPYRNKILYDKKLEKYWRQIKSDFKPDIIHIQGSEFPIGLSYVNGCGPDGVILSMQGLIHQISRYRFDGLSFNDLLSSFTLYDILHLKLLPFTIFAYKQRSKYEIDLIKKISFIIGRTSWDEAHSKALNPNIKYYKLNELLRPSFYNSSWCIEKCQPHRIFVSQAYVPIKGLHFLIKAISIIKQRFPDVSLYIAGADIINHGPLKIRGYGAIIKKLAKKYGVSDCIHFTGYLSEEMMKDQYLKANCYVCCSSIENSPNSVCEAQILGTPVVSSFVGGIPDFIKSNKTGLLYRAEDYASLAFAIMKIFELPELANELSIAEKNIATQRHKTDTFASDLRNIYHDILGKND